VIRVIGLGSPFGEDRAGWLVIDELQGRIPQSVEAIALDRPGAALVNWMRDCAHLVLVDAVLDPERCGTYARLSVDDLARPSPVSGHTLDLAQSFALADRLGQKPKRIELYGIFINNLETVSKPVSDCIPRLSIHLARHLVAACGASSLGC
jgi:hydrogenase maturation protease